MNDLQAQYGISLRRRLAILEQLSRLEHAEAEVRLHEIAHALKGSGATYGFPELSRIASRAELATGSDLPAALDDLLDVVRRVIDRCPPPDMLEHRGKT